MIAEAAEFGAAIVAIVPVGYGEAGYRRAGGRSENYYHHSARAPGAGTNAAFFRYSLLQQAFRPRARMASGTDESSLVERLDQVEVRVVLGSDRNIKITKPGDMDLARLFMEQEAAGRRTS